MFRLLHSFLEISHSAYCLHSCLKLLLIWQRFVFIAAQSPVTVPPKMQHTVESSLTGDSPGRKFTSALNTHTSVLNTADDSVSGSPLQLSGRAGVGEDSLGEVEKSRKESWSSDEDSSDGSSASDHESESGTAGSSSDGEREAKIHQGGGKTVPGPSIGIFSLFC